MNDTKIMTECQDFRKILAVNYSTNGYPIIAPTNIEPSGDGIIELGLGSSQNAAVVVSYGVGADNTTFNMRLIGWRQIGGNNPATSLWIPVNLCEVQCTLGATTGVAGMVIDNTNLFVDTITLVTGNDNVSIDRNSPADDTIAHIVADLKGFRKLQPIFTTGGSATSCNGILALI